MSPKASSRPEVQDMTAKKASHVPKHRLCIQQAKYLGPAFLMARWHGKRLLMRTSTSPFKRWRWKSSKGNIPVLSECPLDPGAWLGTSHKWPPIVITILQGVPSPPHLIRDKTEAVRLDSFAKNWGWQSQKLKSRRFDSTSIVVFVTVAWDDGGWGCLAQSQEYTSTNAFKFLSSKNVHPSWFMLYL